MEKYNIKIEGSMLNNSPIGHIEYGVVPSLEDEKLLQELQKIQNSLEKTEPMVANALGELQQALKEQNKPKISNLLAQLSTGFAANVLSSLASLPLLHFLGIS